MLQLPGFWCGLNASRWTWMIRTLQKSLQSYGASVPLISGVLLNNTTRGSFYVDKAIIH